MYEIEFTDDDQRFRDRAQTFLSTHPVTTSVVATTVARSIRETAQAVTRDPERPWWFATVHDHDQDGRPVVGIAMRTAPAADPPIWVNEMPDDAAIQLAQLLHDRSEHIPGVNGALPAARLIAEESARLQSGRAEIERHSRLFEFEAPARPAEVPGRLRLAVAADAELLHSWRTIFHAEAAAQAGQPATEDIFVVDLDFTRRRIEAGELWVWERDGEVVHYSGASRPAFGVSRIGPVFTPKEHRGQGYAAAAVFGISEGLVDQGARVCLFTDQANPVSNELYQRIGYRPVVDMANFKIN